MCSEWDVAFDLIKDKMFDLSGANNSIATKIDQEDDDYMQAGSNARRILPNACRDRPMFLVAS